MWQRKSVPAWLGEELTEKDSSRPYKARTRATRTSDGPPQLTRRVVRARAAPLFARLEHHCALRHEVGRRGGIDHRQERRVQVPDRRRLRCSLLDLVGELPVGAVLEPLVALACGLPLST